MNTTAIFKLSYGVFFLGCEDNGKKNVCVINTAAQVTQTPLRICITVLKSNLTDEMVLSAQKFSIGVMGQHTPLGTISHYGGQSGRATDKLAGQAYQIDGLGNPLVSDGCIATLSCKVCQTIDLDTHHMYIADIIEAEVLSEDNPLTYQDYRDYKAGIRKPDQPTGEEVTKKDVWQCTVCHYVYDGDIPFEELPDDYVCPICHQPKSVFEKIQIKKERQLLSFSPQGCVEHKNNRRPADF